MAERRSTLVTGARSGSGAPIARIGDTAFATAVDPVMGGDLPEDLKKAVAKLQAQPLHGPRLG